MEDITEILDAILDGLDEVEKDIKRLLNYSDVSEDKIEEVLYELSEIRSNIEDLEE